MSVFPTRADEENFKIDKSPCGVLWMGFALSFSAFISFFSPSCLLALSLSHSLSARTHFLTNLSPPRTYVSCPFYVSMYRSLGVCVLCVCMTRIVCIFQPSMVCVCFLLRLFSIPSFLSYEILHCNSLKIRQAGKRDQSGRPLCQPNQSTK